MYERDSGFTLIETLITCLVLVTGLTAVAGLFSHGARESIRNRQRTAAIVLLQSRLEALRNTAQPGTYTESLEMGADGTPLPGEANSTFRITWSVGLESPRLVSVTVFGRMPGNAGVYLELARAATLVGPRF